MSTFKLYLIRHGLAGQHGDYKNDVDRSLTDEGKRKTHQVAKRFAELNLTFDLILTSPLIRTKQTAAILKDVGLTNQLEDAAYLAPGGNIQDWVNWLDGWKASEKSLALVGHEPDLSAWAEVLIWGESQEKLILKKAGAIGLSLPVEGSPIANSQLFWFTPPRFLTA